MRIHTVFSDEFPEPWASDWGEDDYGIFMGFTYQGVRQDFRWIESGTFLMGAPENEPERESNETQHKVTLSRGFWLADTTVTQALWEAVMGENPNRFKRVGGVSSYFVLNTCSLMPLENSLLSTCPAAVKISMWEPMYTIQTSCAPASRYRSFLIRISSRELEGETISTHSSGARGNGVTVPHSAMKASDAQATSATLVPSGVWMEHSAMVRP